jgi:hypothetical protein
MKAKYQYASILQMRGGMAIKPSRIGRVDAIRNNFSNLIEARLHFLHREDVESSPIHHTASSNMKNRFCRNAKTH